MNDHFATLIELYQSARINRVFFEGSAMALDHGHSEISLEAKPEHHHGMNAVHGSVYFKLLDDAAYFAAQTAEKKQYLVTTGFHIHLLRPVSEGLLKATGNLRLKSAELYIADAVLYNAQGKEIAYGTGHFAKSSIKIETK